MTVADAFGSNTQAILVTVLDVADTPNTPPQILAPLALPGLPAVFVLTSLSQGVVGQVVALDPDGDTLEYQLFGEDIDIFSIDAATGGGLDHRPADHRPDPAPELRRRPHLPNSTSSSSTATADRRSSISNSRSSSAGEAGAGVRRGG